MSAGIKIGDMFAPERAELQHSGDNDNNDPRQKMLRGLQELGVKVPDYTVPITEIDGTPVENSAGKNKEAAIQLRGKI